MRGVRPWCAHFVAGHVSLATTAGNQRRRERPLARLKGLAGETGPSRADQGPIRDSRIATKGSQRKGEQRRCGVRGFLNRNSYLCLSEPGIVAAMTAFTVAQYFAALPALPKCDEQA
jgi:hypothetical protein